MAEIDGRRDYRGGGGGGGRGGQKRKRFRGSPLFLPTDQHLKFRQTDFPAEDDDVEQGFRNQRHRPEAPPGTRIRRALLDIGEDAAPNLAPRSTRSVAESIAKLTAEHWEDEYVRDTFCSVVLKL